MDVVATEILYPIEELQGFRSRWKDLDNKLEERHHSINEALKELNEIQQGTFSNPQNQTVNSPKTHISKTRGLSLLANLNYIMKLHHYSLLKIVWIADYQSVSILIFYSIKAKLYMGLV